MGPAGKALRYFETLRQLRPVQLTNRLTRKLPRVSLDRSPPPPLRRRADEWCFPIDRGVRLFGPDTITLINRPGRIADAAAWNDPGQPRLWLYNLHYFDWLIGERSEVHRGWERALIERWISENPPGEGAGWEPYPLSLRIANWVKWLLAGDVPLPGMLDSLALQLRALERSIEWHLLGNHLLANAKALFLGGALFGGTEGDRWLAAGEDLLRDQWRAQILPDGGHEERSAMYHAVLLEDVLDCLNAARVFNLTRSIVGREGPPLAERMLHWLAAMTHPNGQLALFNDASPGIAATPDDLAAYAERLGCAPFIAPTQGLLLLPETGYLRAQAGPAVLLADCAPVGAPHQPGHAHADTLGFELSLHGVPLLVSAGTSTYEIGSQRAWERSTAAHNCVVLDGRNSSDVWAGFRVGRRARVVERKVEPGPPHVIEAAHDGYRFLRGSPEVRRRWTLCADGLTVEDFVRGGSAHQATAWLHFAPAVEVRANGPRARVTGLSGTLELVANAPLTVARTSRSTGFNRTEEAISLCYPLAQGEGRVALGWSLGGAATITSDFGRSSN